MKKEEIILKLLMSLNAGDAGYASDRVDIAIAQYKQLVQRGIVKNE